MAGGKASPRQKMINMMYLVLTALLAMNVSKTILESFVSIDNGQIDTRTSFESKLSAQMVQFGGLAEKNPEKYGPNFNIAKEISDKANDLVSYINRIKAKTISETEGKLIEDVYNAQLDTVMNIDLIASKDNYDVNTNIMFGIEVEPATEKRPEDEENYRAAELKRQLIEYRELVKANIEDKNVQSAVDEMFAFASKENSDGRAVTWEEQNFYHVPLAASTSILSKIQSDIRSAESDAASTLFTAVEGKSYKFTKMKSAVIPQSTNVSQGGKFNAEIFLAAYDDQNKPEIRLGKPGVKFDPETGELTGEFDIVETDSNAIGNLSLPVGGLGQQVREGVIVFRPAGLPEVRESFKLDYNVVAPSLVVSPIKMNVFYKGVDNPVAVGVPGFQDKDIVPSISNGTISKGANGAYVVRVTSGTSANISVTATLPDGSKKTLGPAAFRVKSVPDPVAQFAGKGAESSTVKKNELTAAQGCVAAMKDFDFDLKFKVVSFNISMSVGGQFITQASNGNKVSADQKAILKKAKKGQKVFIEGIKAKGPDGTVRSLGSLSLKVS